MVAGDVDGDGDADAFVEDFDGDYKVLLSDGLGGMQGSAPGALPSRAPWVRLGDVTGDGLDDLVARTVDDGTFVAPGSGGGFFGAATATLPGDWFHAFALGDLNADGDLDLVSIGLDDAYTHLGDGLGGFAFAASAPYEGANYSPDVHAEFRSITTLDFDADGALDFAAASSSAAGLNPLTPINVLYGDGAGGIASVQEIDFLRDYGNFTLADLDGDGDRDLALRLDHTGGSILQTTLYEREGGGFLGPEPLPPVSSTGFVASVVEAGDVDGDGDQDIVHTKGVIEIVRNDGSGNFTVEPGPETTAFPGRSIVADLGGDGVPDLLTLPYWDESAFLSIHTSDGAGGFLPEVVSPYIGISGRAALADWTGDGMLDLFVSTSFDFKLRLSPGQPVGFGTPTELLLIGAAENSVPPGRVYPLDLDLDGNLDGAATMSPPFGDLNIRTFLGDGVGNFTEQQGLYPETHFSSIVTGDFNQDGEWDLLRGDTALHLGVPGPDIQGMGTKLYDIQSTLWDMQAVDLDVDGLLDVVSREGRVLYGEPGGGFAPPVGYFTYQLQGIAVADVHGDGAPDIVIDPWTSDEIALLPSSLCRGSFATYGAGCPGSGALVPSLDGSGCAMPGGSYTLEVTGGPGETVAYASFGLGQGLLPLPNGCDLLLDPWIPVFVGFELDGAGAGSLGIAVSSTSAVGVTSTAQVGIFDLGAPGFYTLTNGLAITVE